MKISYIFFILLLFPFAYATTSINPLTRSQANLLYCLIDGSNCALGGSGSGTYDLNFSTNTGNGFINDNDFFGLFGDGNITTRVSGKNVFFSINTSLGSGGAETDPIWTADKVNYYNVNQTNETISKLRNYTSSDGNLTVNSDTNVITLIGTWFLNLFVTKAELENVNNTISTNNASIKTYVDAQVSSVSSKGSVQPIYNDSSNYYFNYSGINESVKQTIQANVTSNFIMNLIDSIISAWINANITMIQNTHYNNTEVSLYFQNKSELGTAMQNDSILRTPNMSQFLSNSSVSGSANISIDSAGRIYINTTLGGGAAETDPFAIKNGSSASIYKLNVTWLNATLNATFNSNICLNPNCSRSIFSNGSDVMFWFLS